MFTQPCSRRILNPFFNRFPSEHNVHFQVVPKFNWSTEIPRMNKCIQKKSDFEIACSMMQSTYGTLSPLIYLSNKCVIVYSIAASWQQIYWSGSLSSGPRKLGWLVSSILRSYIRASQIGADIAVKLCQVIGIKACSKRPWDAQMWALDVHSLHF